MWALRIKVIPVVVGALQLQYTPEVETQPGGCRCGNFRCNDPAMCVVGVGKDP